MSHGAWRWWLVIVLVGQGYAIANIGAWGLLFVPLVALVGTGYDEALLRDKGRTLIHPRPTEEGV